MASGFFAVFDDIAVLLDDAVVMSKVATKKAAGVLGDDLAVGAEKASGFSPARELPVLWAISKGSFINKLIILPFAFLLSYFASWSIIPILMLGGLYLAYEGTEKVFEFFFPHGHKVEHLKAMSEEEFMAYEKKKVKSAILTDFILSIEIIIIALGTVLEQPLSIQIIVVSFIALLATVGVYGLVAFIVRLDDMGFKLIAMANNQPGLLKSFGEILVKALPIIIKILSVVGTLAMLLVAGGIYVHNVHAIHEFWSFMPAILGELITGAIVGIIILAIVKLVMRFKAKPSEA